MPSVLLQPGDDRIAPVVCVHPVSGRAEAYRTLARELARPGPVLGLEPPGRDAPPEAYTFAELARGYAGELDPQRPALLLGWSIGGVLAAELGRAIAARGGRVGFVGLLDSRAPQPEMRRRPTDRDSLARFYLHQWALTHEREPQPAPASTAPDQLLATLRAIGAGDEPADEAELERRLAVFMALVRGFFHHEQAPVPVPLHLFESADAHPSHPKPPTLGWDHLTPRLERRVIAGTHFTLLADHRVPALADAIGRCLPAPE